MSLMSECEMEPEHVAQEQAHGKQTPQAQAYAEQTSHEHAAHEQTQREQAPMEQEAPAKSVLNQAQSEQIKIILASSSPRRKELLERAGVSFRIMSLDVDEYLEPDDLRSPNEACKKLAERKAKAVVEELLCNESIIGPHAVIGADTMVVNNDEIYGKPKTDEHALQMLLALQGKTHEVVTAVSVWLFNVGEDDEISLGFRTFSDVSKVTFKSASKEELYDYVLCKEGCDKAGAYAAQGRGGEFIERIDGSLDTVIGLPVSRLLREFPYLENGCLQ